MAEYIHVPTGVKVTAADGKQMPVALFKPAEVEKPKKPAPRKRTAKAKTKEQ